MSYGQSLLEWSKPTLTNKCDNTIWGFFISILIFQNVLKLFSSYQSCPTGWPFHFNLFTFQLDDPNRTILYKVTLTIRFLRIFSENKRSILLGARVCVLRCSLLLSLWNSPKTPLRRRPPQPVWKFPHSRLGFPSRFRALCSFWPAWHRFSDERITFGGRGQVRTWTIPGAGKVPWSAKACRPGCCSLLKGSASFPPQF